MQYSVISQIYIKNLGHLLIVRFTCLISPVKLFSTRIYNYKFERLIDIDNIAKVLIYNIQYTIIQ